MYLAGDDVSEDAEVKSAVCIGMYIFRVTRRSRYILYSIRTDRYHMA
jgi:hypothetical protein